jgi:hypothetical protein
LADCLQAFRAGQTVRLRGILLEPLWSAKSTDQERGTIVRLKLVIIIISAALLLSPAAKATTITFNFNSLANGANDSSVQSYMNGVLTGTGGTVTVTGAQASNSYTGDGHVVGPTVNGVVKSNTLATLGGTFIDNVSSSSEIDMTFKNLKIYSVSFDYEIFPDGTCPTGNNCGSNWPDFTFKAGGNQIFETLAVMPGHPGASYTHSPASGVSHTELAPQFLGQSGTFLFPNGVSTLNFIDWPATIAIDNLVISKTPPTPIPEPCTLLLFATGLAGFSGLKRRLRKV